jgi:hypothetical protein
VEKGKFVRRICTRDSRTDGVFASVQWLVEKPTEVLAAGRPSEETIDFSPTGRRKTNEMEGESPSIIKVTWVTNT